MKDCLSIMCGLYQVYVSTPYGNDHIAMDIGLLEAQRNTCLAMQRLLVVVSLSSILLLELHFEWFSLICTFRSWSLMYQRRKLTQKVILLELMVWGSWLSSLHDELCIYILFACILVFWLFKWMNHCYLVSRTPLLEIILDELTYNRHMISPFFQVISEFLSPLLSVSGFLA